MTIRLVRIGDRLVGADFSSRWNLAQLGYTSLSWSRNQADIKRIRRANPDFTFKTVAGPMLAITEVERMAFNRPVRKAA